MIYYHLWKFICQIFCESKVTLDMQKYKKQDKFTWKKNNVFRIGHFSLDTKMQKRENSVYSESFYTDS